MQYSTFPFEPSLYCLVLSIQTIWSAKEFQTNSKNYFQILADQVRVLIPPQKFLGNVSALCWVVLCSMAGALSHALTETIWARPAWASCLHQADCLPKPCHTWVQKIKEPCSAYNHTAAARAKLPSLLHFLCFQHMCFQGWPLILHLCALSGL